MCLHGNQFSGHYRQVGCYREVAAKAGLTVLYNSGVHTRTLNFEVILTTTVPKGIKPGVFVRVDNVAVIKLEDN